MTNEDNHIDPRVRLGRIQWLKNPVRIAVETTVSEYSKRIWKIRGEKDFSEFAYHHCAILTDGSFPVFCKYSEATEAIPQFEAEVSDLKTLSAKAGVLIPQPIDIVRCEGGSLLLMEAVQAVERGPRQWRQIGATLARIHRVKQHTCGSETNGFWGPLHQINTPVADWATFFRDRRLLPLLKTAIESGNIPSSVASQVETLAACIPELSGPRVVPTLLHGDAQQNNFISTAAGTCVIDPAVYYGHPEMDLALLDSFQPVPDAVFEGYRDEMPIDSGFDNRRDLWRIPLYLAAVALEGTMHLNRLTNALNTYM